MVATSLLRVFFPASLLVLCLVPVSAQSLRPAGMMSGQTQVRGMQVREAPFAPAGMRRMRPASMMRQDMQPEMPMEMEQAPAEQPMQPQAGPAMQAPLRHEEAFAQEYVDGPLMEGGCGDACCDTCPPPFVGLTCFPLFHNGVFSIEAGAHGFTGPANRGGAGSFGFHEGFNWGGTFPFTARGISAQVGAMAAQSNFQGADFTIDNRNQVFATAGLFRRVDAGLQGGVVIDYMHDQWYYDLDIGQLRGEVSWVFGCGQEFGFWGAGGFSDKVAESRLAPPNNLLGPQVISERWKTNEIFAFFYRQQLAAGGEGRAFGGFTGNGDGLLGADFTMPLGGCFDVKANMIYLIPKEDIHNNAVNEESWNLSLGLVWYPACRMRCTSSYDRPLFNVADNGVFLLDRTVP